MTDSEIKNAKPKDRIYFITDINGLRVRIAPNGSKIFQMRYTFLGKRKIITIGEYPYVSLSEARKKVAEFKTLALSEIDPQESKKHKETQVKLLEEGQIHLVIERWFETREKNIGKSTLMRDKGMLNLHFLPHFCNYGKDRKIVSSTHIASITRNDIAKIITELQSKSIDTPRRLFAHCFNIWQFALSFDYIQENILLSIDKKQLLPPTKEVHYAKITDESILGELLRAIDAYPNSITIRCALQFVAIIPLRAENLSKLKWEYIDFNKNTLTIPRECMKVKNKELPDFTIPLPPQAIAILKEIERFTGWGKWVFHAHTKIHKPLVYESLNKALRSMGFSDEKRGRKQTIHSFRGTFRSLCETHQLEHNATFEVKEAILDHRVGSKVTIAYSHKADYTGQMRPLLTWWADFLDKLRKE